MARPDATAASAKESAATALSPRLDSLYALSAALHAQPELSFEEHFAAAAIAGTLAEAGFDVDTGLCGLPTAFRARTGSGQLSIFFCAEFDALPGVGHACGHNLIAAVAVGAALSLRGLADDLGMTISVIGTPAEEGGGGKVTLLRGGAFDGAHAAMMIHPWHEDRLTPKCLAVDHLEVGFLGREAHASAAPHKGINAADAMVLSQVAIGLLRQHFLPGDQVHGIVVKGGDAANIVPAETTARYMVRSESLDALSHLRSRIERCFEAGALATGCSMEIRELSPTYSHFVADERLLAAWRSNAESLGRRFDADDRGDPLPTYSTDMGNVSLALPSIHPMLGLDSKGASIHQSAFATVTSGPSARRAVADGALSLSWTAIDAATDEGLRHHLLSLAADQRPG